MREGRFRYAGLILIHDSLEAWVVGCHRNVTQIIEARSRESGEVASARSGLHVSRLGPRLDIGCAMHSQVVKERTRFVHSRYHSRAAAHEALLLAFAEGLSCGGCGQVCACSVMVMGERSI